jgi:hypothetical protein
LVVGSIPGAPWAVAHERAVALLRQGAAGTVQRVNRRAQMVGAMPLGDAAQVPQARLNAFDQRLEALREAELGGLHIGVAEHQVEDQMGKGHATQRDGQRGQVGEVGLGVDARQMALGEDDFLTRTVLRPPRRHLPLQRPQLDGLVAPRVQRAEQGKQRSGLQRRVALELADHPRPVRLERVRARTVATRLHQLAGQAAASLIGTGRAYAHPGTRRGLLLGSTFGSFSQHAEDLRVPFHGALLHEGHRPRPPLRSSAQSAILVVVGGSSNCR